MFEHVRWLQELEPEVITEAAIRRKLRSGDDGSPATVASAGPRYFGFVTGGTREGTCWCGPTTWRGRTAMRVSVSGWCTTDADIDASAAAVRKCAG